MNPTEQPKISGTQEAHAYAIRNPDCAMIWWQSPSDRNRFDGAEILRHEITDIISCLDRTSATGYRFRTQLNVELHVDELKSLIHVVRFDGEDPSFIGSFPSREFINFLKKSQEYLG